MIQMNFRNRMISYLGIVCILPYAIVYLFNLWGFSHYQFFPLLLPAVGYLGYSRWSDESASKWSVAGGWLAFVLGLLVAMGATLFASTWMAYFAFVLFAAALLARVRDADSERSLAYLAVPLLLIWQPPYSPNVTGDGVLIARLQNASAGISSRTLDMLGVVHECPGTVIRCVGKSFGVEEACSGVQSFFALLCFAALIFAYYRRTMLHGCLLGFASVFWAVAMNTVRITVIPLAYVTMGADLSHGLLHTLLGLSTMAAGLLLLLSTDSLLNLLVSQLGFGGSSSLKPVLSTENTGPSRFSQVMLYVATPMLAVMLFVQTYDIATSWGMQKHKVDFFSSSVLVDLYESDGPERVADWTKVAYSHEDRVRGADFGERSDVWTYDAADSSVILSLDQAFPGWHELTVCYTNVGWELQQREVLDAGGWPIVRAQFARSSGEQAILVYSMFDESGRSVDAPVSWSSWNALKERVKNRLSPNVRGALFSLAAYQVQLFASHDGKSSQQYSEELVSALVEARTHLRDAALRRM